MTNGNPAEVLRLFDDLVRPMENRSTVVESVAALEEWMSRDDVLGTGWPWPEYTTGRCGADEVPWVKRGGLDIPKTWVVTLRLNGKVVPIHGVTKADALGTAATLVVADPMLEAQ